MQHCDPIGHPSLPQKSSGAANPHRSIIVHQRWFARSCVDEVTFAQLIDAPSCHPHLLTNGTGLKEPRCKHRPNKGSDQQRVRRIIPIDLIYTMALTLFNLTKLLLSIISTLYYQNPTLWIYVTPEPANPILQLIVVPLALYISA